MESTRRKAQASSALHFISSTHFQGAGKASLSLAIPAPTLNVSRNSTILHQSFNKLSILVTPYKQRVIYGRSVSCLENVTVFTTSIAGKSAGRSVRDEECEGLGGAGFRGDRKRPRGCPPGARYAPLGRSASLAQRPAGIILRLQ